MMGNLRCCNNIHWRTRICVTVQCMSVDCMTLSPVKLNLIWTAAVNSRVMTGESQTQSWSFTSVHPLHYLASYAENVSIWWHHHDNPQSRDIINRCALATGACLKHCKTILKNSVISCGFMENFIQPKDMDIQTAWFKPQIKLVTLTLRCMKSTSVMHSLMLSFNVMSWHGNTFCITDPLYRDSMHQLPAGGFPAHTASNVFDGVFVVSLSKLFEQTVYQPLKWDALPLMWHQPNVNQR